VFHATTCPAATFTDVGDDDFIGRSSAAGRVVDFHAVTEEEGQECGIGGECATEGLVNSSEVDKVASVTHAIRQAEA